MIKVMIDRTLDSTLSGFWSNRMDGSDVEKSYHHEGQVHLIDQDDERLSGEGLQFLGHLEQEQGQ